MTWPTAALEEFCRPRQWPTISQSDLTPSGYPVYGANGRIGWYISYNHERETVLITCRGATCGTINVCPPRSYVTGNAMALDDLDESRVNLRFLVHALTPDRLQRAITGTAQPQITRESLRGVVIPLPPLDEQCQIAAILDEADSLRVKRRRILDHLSDLSDSFFVDMFGDTGAEDRFGSEPLGELVDFYSGGTPSKKQSDWWMGPLPWFSPKDLKTQDLWDSIDHLSREVLNSTSLKQIPANTVVIVVRGMILAHTVPIGMVRVPCTINQDLKALLPRVSIEPTFLRAALSVQHNRILASVSTAAHGTKRLETSALRNVRIPRPGTTAEQEFASRITALSVVQNRELQAIAENQVLFASLQSRAFTGQL
ncbi:hypothetical protein MSIMFI_02985 [Mycobacterium simulans]|nr:hypothetical protein MSIMFI_02985 [Mycobacterium simulans]